MKRIKTDICIVGTGFSGTFIASTLRDTSARILMVDRGAFLSRERLEENYFFKNPYKTGDAYIKSWKDIDTLREAVYDDPEFREYEHVNSGRDTFTYSGAHLVGGTSHLWFGNALRKVPNDFLTKTSYGFGVDWPISYNDLEDYYYRAEVEMGVSGPPRDLFTPFRKKPFPLPPFTLPPGAIEINRMFNGTGFELTPSHKARLPVDTETRVACCGAGTCFLFCPADARYNCLTTHLKDVLLSKQVDLLNEHTVSRLVQKGESIAEAVAFDREGNTITIQADIFILAANAIENARILLLSQFHHLKTNFASRSRVIGKYLADQVGIWVPIANPHNLYIGCEKTLQSTHSLSFYDGPFRKHHSGVVAEVYFTHVPQAIPKIANADDAQKLVMDEIRKGYYGSRLKRQVFSKTLGQWLLCLEMEMMSEERNCLSLHQSQKDAHGDPVTEFRFSIWDQPYLKRSVEHYRTLFTGMAEKAGGQVGSITLRNSFDHMLGTCRMGIDPHESVVDENLKSHDHTNLYIVGGSAFPTAGSTNPTLTIVALALRCGDHIRALIR